MTRRWRGAVAVALLALGAPLQGCAGIAVQLPRSAQLDPAAVAAELRAARGPLAAPARAGSRPRPAHLFEHVDTSGQGRRITYTYTQWPNVCRPLVIGLGPFWPGCARKDVYVVESGRLVAASRKEHVTHGFFCSPLLLFRLSDGALPCWWEWG